MGFIKSARLLILSAIILSAMQAFSQAQMPSRDLGLVLKFKEDNKEQQVKLYEKSYALLIGVSNYTNGWPSLPGVKKDIESVKQLLLKNNFEITIIEDPDSEKLQKAFSDFIKKYGLKSENRLLFYFAGHGHTLKQAYGEDMGYIVPTDAPNPNRDKEGFFQKAVDMQQIDTYARQIQSKHALFLFDSCFSGSIFDMVRAVPEDITYKTTKPVRQFISSGSAEENVPDRSIFCEQLNFALQGEGDRDKDGYITGTELGEYLRKTVTNYSKGSQHPQYGKIKSPKLDKGDFVFEIASVKKPEAAAAISKPIDDIPATPVSSDLDSILQNAEKKKKFVEAAKKEYTKADTIDGDANISKEDKVKAWDFYLKNYKASGFEIAKAEERKTYWIYYKADDTPTPEPPPAPASSEGKNYTEDLGGGVKLEMVWIPGGTFQMGSNDYDFEGPVHSVTLEGFWMGKYEVTQRQWQTVMGNNPSYFKGDDLPVEQVSWDDCQKFITKINQKAGKNYALPSEAQWEYACRAGSTWKYCFGDLESGLDDYAWYGYEKAGKTTHPVGQKKANGFGLYDMHGNVWEWCEDWYHGNYEGAPADGSAWLSPVGSYRVFRGGSWVRDPQYCRSADRNYDAPSGGNDILGFRLLRTR